MELLLRVIPDGVHATDVAVDVTENTTVHELQRSLEEFFSERQPVLHGSRLRVGEAELDLAHTVFEAGITNGTIVVFHMPDAEFADRDQVIDQPSDDGRVAEHVPSAQSEGVQLEVITGRDAGRSFALPPGTYLLGRARYCDVRLQDFDVAIEHVRIEVRPDAGAILVHPVPGSKASTTLHDVEIKTSRLVALGEVVHLGGVTAFSVQPRPRPGSLSVDLLGHLPFNRSPHRPVVVTHVQLDDLRAPPATPMARPLPWLEMLLPLVGGLILALFSGQFIYLMFTLLSPAMLISRHVADSRIGSRQYRRERREFLDALTIATRDVDQALRSERQSRHLASPSTSTVVREVEARGLRLWERGRGSTGFLTLRLGLGDTPSNVSVSIESGGDNDLRVLAKGTLAHHAVVRDAPVTIDLEANPVTAICGARDAALAMANALLVQAAGLHSPNELVVALASSRKGMELSDVKWLPHCRSANSPVDGPHIALDPGTVRDLMARVLQAYARGPDLTKAPRVLLVVDELARADRAELARLIDEAVESGLRVLWVGSDERAVPRACTAIIRCESPHDGTVWHTDPSRPERNFVPEGIDSRAAVRAYRQLSALDDANAANRTTAIPRQTALLDVTTKAELVAQIASRWTSRSNGLECTLGVTATGPMRIDLALDGPHALVAGTSGAGKSELLQSWVASLAIEHSPEALNFLFVDYKGGATGAAFVALPHTAGYVTNLDRQTSARALVSLRAELDRRMSLLEGRASSVDELRQIDSASAPPRLVIIIDEFATLIREMPAFVEGIVDVAQRGRSLGIHLVLATQRPAGSVNESILANTNLRIALRVVDREDSISVIDSPEAATIPVPLKGRAFARLGPGELVAFQCAWSGAPVVTRSPSPQVVEFQPDLEVVDAPLLPGAMTQLDLVTDAALTAALRLGFPQCPAVWLPQLPSSVSLASLRADSTCPRPVPGRHVLLGIADVPEHQRRMFVDVDLESSGGLIIYGGSGTGLSTAVRSIAFDQSAHCRPEDLSMYVFDCGRRSLDSLSLLPHCAGVVTDVDIEATTRMIELLHGELTRRQRDPAVSPVTHKDADCGDSTRRRPNMLVMIDGFGRLRETLESNDAFDWSSMLQRMITEGPHVGIVTVITADRRSAIPSTVAGRIATKLVLHTTDPEEMSSIGVDRNAAVRFADVPGRALLDGKLEMQLATASDEPSIEAQETAIAELAARCRMETRCTNVLPVLPNHLRLDKTHGVQHSDLTIGIEDLTGDHATIDSERHMLVVGPPQSGKTTTLERLASVLGVCRSDRTVVKVNWRPSSDEFATDDCVARSNPEEIRRLVASGHKIHLLIDDASDLDEAMVHVVEQVATLSNVSIIAAMDDLAVARMFGGWTAIVRGGRQLLVLQPASRVELEQLTGVRFRIRPGQSFPPGRAVLVTRRTSRLIQVALPFYETASDSQAASASTDIDTSSFDIDARTSTVIA